MFKQKLTGAVLAVCLFAGAGGLALHAGTTSNAAVTASAAQTQLDTESASLFLPESYEQYLTLGSPVDIAVSERYVAIAEESKIYIFDRDEKTPTYHIYTHSANHEQAQISKLQFSDDQSLYFSDTSLGFYQLDLSDLDNLKTVTEKSLAALTTFHIVGETLFKATVVDKGTTYLSALLSNPEEGKQFGFSDEKVTPHLSYSNDNLYSIVGSLVTVFSDINADGTYSATESFTLQAGLSGLKSAIVLGDSLFYSVNGSSFSTVSGGLYCFDFTSQQYELLLAGDDFGALTSYDGKLYAVKGNAVMEYSLSSGVEKTDYEISSSSDSVNRLSNATDSARAGNLLVTADAGNHRLSVYDFTKKQFSILPLSYSPKFVATDGEIIAAASEETVYLYGRNRIGVFEQTFSNAATTISGLACLYGNCYYVTHSFGYGKIERAENGFNVAFCTRDALDQTAPTALTSDLYGNLYTVCSDGTVIRFTEENFADKNTTAQGEKLAFKLPASFSCVRADFEGNLYCLNSEKALYRFTQDAPTGEELASIDGTDFVYSEEENISPVSYALGFEDDCVYFNFGNFIVKTNAGALGFPTLSTIDAAGIRETLDAVHAPEEVRHMDVQQGAIGIKVDLATLTEDTVYFPYDSYARTEEPCRGVLLAEKGNYLLIALYHDRAYDVRLFRNDQCTETEIAAEAHAETKHLSSDCRLYNYPCIADAYSETLPRGTVLKVLSTVAADPDAAAPDLGYTFAYVEVETKSRETIRGYVPLSFLTDTDPAGEGDDSFELAKLKEDAVFTDGEETKRLEKGTEVKLYQNEDGTYLGTYTDEEGRTWSQVLSEDMIERGESDALRISLIVGLSVLALVIIGVYFALLPHKKKS